jgi:hypothetical protein
MKYLEVVKRGQGGCDLMEPTQFQFKARFCVLFAVFLDISILTVI